jgi:hypothetical protein
MMPSRFPFDEVVNQGSAGGFSESASGNHGGRDLAGGGRVLLQAEGVQLLVDDESGGVAGHRKLGLFGPSGLRMTGGCPR